MKTRSEVSSFLLACVRPSMLCFFVLCLIGTPSATCDGAQAGGGQGSTTQKELEIRDVLARNPSSLNALRSLSEDLEEEGKWKAALPYRRALALNTTSKDLLLALGICQMESGDLTAAIATLRNLTHLFPTDADIFANLGVALARDENFNGAEQAFDQALSIDGTHLNALLSLAKTQITLAKFTDAAETARRYVNSVPSNPMGHALLARALAEMNHFDEAVGEFRKAGSLDRDSELVLGRLLREHGMPREAILHFERAIVLDPHKGDAHFQLTRCYAMLGDRRAAEREQEVARVEFAAEASRRQSAVLLGEGEALADAGNYKAAVERYRRALRLSPENTQPIYALAVSLDREGDKEQEKNLLEEAIAHGAQSAVILAQLAFLKGEAGDEASAERGFNSALAQDPQCVAALTNLAVLRAKSGKLDDAFLLLSQATEIEPGNAQAAAQLGVVLAARGQVGDARRSLQRALTLDKTNQLAAQALVRLQ